MASLRVNKQMLKKIINNLKLGSKGNPEFTSFITRSGKYNTEIIIGTQMVMLNRSYDEALQICIDEMEQSKLNTFINSI